MRPPPHRSRQALRPPQSGRGRQVSAFLLYPGRAAVMPVDAVLATIPKLPRAAIDRLVARMIERLDETDGNLDAEPDDEDQCGAGDDGCAPVVLNGRTLWGSDLEDESDQ